MIGAPENKRLHDAFAAKDANAVIDIISRQTGRALFQACQHQILEASDNSSVLLNKLKDGLLQTAAGSRHGSLLIEGRRVSEEVWKEILVRCRMNDMPDVQLS